MVVPFLSPTTGTNNTLVNETDKDFCQETLTKTASTAHFVGQEILTLLYYLPVSEPYPEILHTQSRN
jgi:hypothetical protein